MKRPCNCDKDGCRLCWLYHNDIRYYNMWTDKKLPSKIEQITNAMIALRKRIESEFKNVADEVYKQRMSICENCPNKTQDWKCTKCGCHLNLKARWSSEKCPENRWPLIITEEKKGCGCANK